LGKRSEWTNEKSREKMPGFTHGVHTETRSFRRPPAEWMQKGHASCTLLQ
jgi:hypothetical protein